MVAEFHRVFGQAVSNEPNINDDHLNELRIGLLDEELNELVVALAGRDPVATLDALTDLQYVLDGTYLALGFADVKDEAFRVVHASNMAKLGPDGRPVLRDDGKILKPPGWTPPDLGLVLAPIDFDVSDVAHAEPKATDYCTTCGESPDSATHWLPSWSGGHDYTDPREVSRG